MLFWAAPAPAALNELAYTWTTLAGRARGADADGVGGNAQFFRPAGTAVDQAGNVYVVEWGATIRKITPAGVVSTLAGYPQSPGSADGVGSNARFGSFQGGASGIAIDSATNLYVADGGNHTIRKVTRTGTNWVVTTIAGSAGSPGSADGTGSSARFYFPAGVAVDSATNLYVADSYNHTIRKITLTGTNWVVTTIAGSAENPGSADGTGSAAQFNYPGGIAGGIAVDRAGNLYVADSDNHTLRRITHVGVDWVVNTIAGAVGIQGAVDGMNGDARFSYPSAITVDGATNLYLTEGGTHLIRKVTRVGADWVVSQVAGRAGISGAVDGTGTNAQFYGPSGIALDSTGSFLFVGDFHNGTVRQVTIAGVVSTVAGSATASTGIADGTGDEARFNSPQGVAADRAGSVYVADTENRTIRKITAAGVVTTVAGLAGSSGNVNGVGSNARFNFSFGNSPGIAVDSAGNIYVADTGNSRIRKITPTGVVSTPPGFPGGSPSLPTGLAVDSADNLYVADAGNHTIRKISTGGVVSTIAGLAGVSGSADGPGASARFNAPYGIAIDGANNLFVMESQFDVFRKLTPVGNGWIVSSISGIGGGRHGIVADAAGTVFFTSSNTGDSKVRKITPAGVVTELGGLGGGIGEGSADGTGSAARFMAPTGIALDSVGNLYVADTGNNTIRKGVFTQFGSLNAVSYSPPPMNGRLVITLEPSGANGQWRFPWEFGWRNSGVTVSNIVAGNYPIEFREVPGFFALPIESVQVTSGGTTAVTNQYYPTISAEDAGNGPGSLTVYLGPTPPVGAGWRFLGESEPFLATGFTTNLPPATYLVEFAFVSGHVKPPSQSLQVRPSQPTVLSVNYPIAAEPPLTGLLPHLVPANQVNNETTYPFGFNGQLKSDTGYGSGVAVDTHVVLTAGHLVFDDATLSYVSHAYWYFRRSAGVNEPLPQPARSFFVLSGYAERRTNEFPVPSTPQTRNLDVAAIYFPDPVAGGGHGGYLPSDAVPNTWLTSTALKMLVGYPVDGSQFGDASIVPGKMFQTDPQPYPLTIAPDAVPEQQQVYLAPWFLSYPGNSGGPFYVQLNGTYYPAGVYLGSLYNGNIPYASAVRAIDSSVVNLITNAAALGASGTNFTGGGVTSLTAGIGGSAFDFGLFQVVLGPSEAVAAGGGWRLVQAVGTNFLNDNSVTYSLHAGTNYALTFRPAPGFVTPENLPLRIVTGQTTNLLVNYVGSAPEAPALLDFNPLAGLTVAGSTGATYRVDFATNLLGTNTVWIPLATQTLSSSSATITNLGPPTNKARYFRAVLVP